ncbi:ABC transporter ATP-binding protein [Yinghuangia aomiensis]
MPRPSGGIVLDGRDLAAYPAKQLARILGSAAAIVHGTRRHHRRRPGRPRPLPAPRPAAPVVARRTSASSRRPCAATGVADLADRPVDELSGGQRQRVWIAMVLAQETPLLLLDEPTTFLDLAYQIDVLDLCARLHREQDRTLVAVLHDLNQAARYATHLIAMRDGRIVAEGPPADIVTADLVGDVFGLRCRVIADPETGTPLVIPAAPSRK